MKENMFYGAEPILFEFAKRMRECPTEAEAYLWKYLSGGLLGHRFRRQHLVKYFIADFYCHTCKLVIEVDGDYHRIPEQYTYDCKRDCELEQLGITVLRFTNKEVINDMEHVILIIKSYL